MLIAANSITTINHAKVGEVDGTAIAKRGRIPGRTESPRLKRLDLTAWREA